MTCDEQYHVNLAMPDLSQDKATNQRIGISRDFCDLSSPAKLKTWRNTCFHRGHDWALIFARARLGTLDCDESLLKLTTPLRILVAEDDPIISLLLGDVLVGLGHEVCAIVDSEDGAVAAALELKPDLLLVDARLRAGSGGEAVRRILNHMPVRCIFMSGDTATLRTLKTRGCVLEKPFQEADLDRAIQEVMAAPA